MTPDRVPDGRVERTETKPWAALAPDDPCRVVLQRAAELTELDDHHDAGRRLAGEVDLASLDSALQVLNATLSRDPTDLAATNALRIVSEAWSIRAPNEPALSETMRASGTP